MKKLILMMLAVSFLLVGCGHKSLSVASPSSANWVSLYNSIKPTVYYKLTKDKVNNIGKFLGTIRPHSKVQPQGPSGWTTNIDNKKIEVKEISGVDKSEAVAVKISKNGPYFKAIKQNKKP